MTSAINTLDSLLTDMEEFSVTRGEVPDKSQLEAELDDLTEALKKALESGEEVVGRCEACQEEISDPSVLTVVGDRTYHQSCFVCTACGEELTGRYYQVNGNNYCQKDRQVSLPNCGLCGESLTEQFVTINGEHFPQYSLLKLYLFRPILPHWLLHLQSL